jgi:hypothetical protein
MQLWQLTLLQDWLLRICLLVVCLIDLLLRSKLRPCINLLQWIESVRFFDQLITWREI